MLVLEYHVYSSTPERVQCTPVFKSAHVYVVRGCSRVSVKAGYFRKYKFYRKFCMPPVEAAGSKQVERHATGFWGHVESLQHVLNLVARESHVYIHVSAAAGYTCILYILNLEI